MATRGMNTMAEGLASLMGDIAQMKAQPDADLQFLIELETMILRKLREPVDNMAGQMAGPGAGPGPVPGMGPGSTPPGPDMGGMPMGPPPGPPRGEPGGSPRGMMMGPGAPNPDELRRLMQGGPGAQ